MNEQLKYLNDALKKESGIKYQLQLHKWQTDFFRFYQSQTNYNISKDLIALSAELYKGKKPYSFSIDSPDQAKIDSALKTALEMIDHMPEDPDFVDLEDDLTLAEPKDIPNNINEISLDKKTAILSRLAKIAGEHDFELFGTFICNFESDHLINSNHLDKISMQSPIYLEVKAVHRKTQVTVLETFGGEDFGYFDEEQFSRNLLAKIKFAQNSIVDVEPGEYEVILAPRCVAEFAQYLAYGMSAFAIDRRSSFFEGKLDSKVFPEIFSLTDDPNDPELIHCDYGDGGHIYRPLKLIDKGYFRAFMCNNYFHHKLGLPKNGNQGNCLSIAPGSSTLEKMISKVKKGLYISSLHYMNFINPKETSLTGLTRDGTFLIEDGKITKVVNNLRFTEKIARIFENVVELEDTAKSIPFSGNYADFSVRTTKAPHAHIARFNISSSTRTI